jgi:predicted nucleotidyltransferase
MTTADSPPLPAQTEELLADLVLAAKRCFADDLRSVILFGSGAEGQLRATSDLNLLFVLKHFDQAQVDKFREPLRLAQVAGRARTMFLLESELSAAGEAFAVKFDDIGRRRRVLYGDDVIAGLVSSRAARKQRLNQILLNLSLRLRERYASLSLREEQLVAVITDAAGPLRSAAATLLDLEGKPASTPRAALEAVAGAMKGSGCKEALARLSAARESGSLPPGTAAETMFQLMALAGALRTRAEQLP